MVRWTGLLLAYLALPLACLTSSEASAGEREEIGLASYYSQARELRRGSRSTETRLLAPSDRTLRNQGTRDDAQDGQARDRSDQ
jgi:hypothetical protein